MLPTSAEFGNQDCECIWDAKTRWPKTMKLRISIIPGKNILLPYRNTYTNILVYARSIGDGHMEECYERRLNIWTNVRKTMKVLVP